MMRAATILWVVLAAVIGTGLFQVKHVVQEMDDELARLNRAIAAEYRNIHVLKAEWSYHNQPQRLQELAQRHLDMQPMKPAQIARVADLARRDPAQPPAPVQTAGSGQPARPVAGRGGRAEPPPPPPPVAAPRPVADASGALQRGPR